MSGVDQSQEPVFALLSDPATHGGARVTRIDTHAASVFLAGERAYKVKRAVRFPFLDFSTLEKRKCACKAEIEVNRPFAPEIYLRVVPITRTQDGALALDGHGTPIEWAVEMRRFDESRTLDHLAREGQIDVALAEALGGTVAAAHAKAVPVEPKPWIDAMQAYIAEHAREFARAPDLFPPAQVAELVRLWRASAARVRELLVWRGRLGFIRHIHGDLHLGNIVLIHDRPVPFDAIEFSPLIASGDTLYDLAFLLMDLIERGLLAPANVVFNRYLLDSGNAQDLDALAALPFYLSMRAAIRAKVTLERLQRARPAERGPIGTSAHAYFELACRAMAPPPPMLVALGGLSGTGKSVLARALAPDLGPLPGAVVLRSDLERKALFFRRESEKLSAAAYTPEARGRVYAAICEKARRTIAAGQCAIIDAVFAQAQERVLAQATAAALGVAFRGLFLEAPLAVRLERVGARSHDASDADAAVARAQERYALGALDWRRIDAAGSPAGTLERARAALR